MSISKKNRFEVFKRDKFTCQYCGREAPDVTLEVDHIKPVSKGGEDDMINLVTSCFDCNRGKSNTELSDDTAIKKRKQQLNELQERREQLEMLVAWHRELANIDQQTTDAVSNFWSELLFDEYSLSSHGEKELSKLVRKYGLNEVLTSMRISVDQYLVISDDGSITAQSVKKSFEYIAKICANRKLQKDKPYLKRLYYIRGILRNRLPYCGKNWESIKIMEDAHLQGMNIDDIQGIAETCDTWTQFKQLIARWVLEELQNEH